MDGRRSGRTRLPITLVVAVAVAVAACSDGERRAVTPTSPPATVTPTSPPATPLPSTTSAPPPSIVALPTGLIGVDVTRLQTPQHVVALTFDAGANADGVPKILAVLRAKKAPATFFLTGSWAGAFPQQAHDIGSQFAIGDHSMTHPHFNQLSDDEVRVEVEQAREAIRAATGVDPRPLFRFPFGEHNTHNRTLVNELGYVSIGWTVDTLGWEGTSGGRTAESVRQRVLASLQPGEVVLMHVGSNPTDHSTLDADALAATIDEIRAAGYGFVAVPQGLGLA